MTAPLHQLLQVQDLDLAADQLRHRGAHLPERSELAEIDSAAATLAGERRGLDARREDVGRRQSAAEGELAATEARIAALERRLYGGDVSASRDLQAMSEEIAHLRERVSSFEDQVLELLEEREPLDQRDEQIGAELAALAGRRSEVTDRLAGAEAAVGEELSAVAGRRAEAVTGLPADLVATYERLRARSGGIGVARLVGNHCDGCHLTLPAVELERVRHLPEGEIYTCEQCSRILVP